MMREKHRYILVESTIEIDANDKSFQHELFKELIHNLGEINYYRANPRIMKYIGDRKFILKCNLARYKEMIIALTFVKKLNGKDIGLYTINASGTILAL